MLLCRTGIRVAPGGNFTTGGASLPIMRETNNTLRMMFALVPVVLIAFPGIAALQGEQAPDFRLADTSGREHALSAYRGRVVVLQFWSFKCPVSLAYDERMADLQRRYAGRGVVFLGVASSRNESPAEVGRNARNLNIAFPMLLDSDGALAERLGATHAPAVFIFDPSGVLRYRGAIDNNRKSGERGRIAYAEDALEAVLAGRPVPQPETREFGCSIRRTPD